MWRIGYISARTNHWRTCAVRLALAERVRRPPAARARRIHHHSSPVGPLCGGDGRGRGGDGWWRRPGRSSPPPPQRRSAPSAVAAEAWGCDPLRSPDNSRWSRCSWQARAAVSVAQQVGGDRGRIAAAAAAAVPSAERVAQQGSGGAVAPRRKAAPAAQVLQLLRWCFWRAVSESSAGGMMSGSSSLPTPQRAPSGAVTVGAEGGTSRTPRTTRGRAIAGVVANAAVAAAQSRRELGGRRGRPSSMTSNGSPSQRYREELA